MHSKTLQTLNKVIINCTVHYIVHLQCTFSLSHTYESKEFWRFSLILGSYFPPWYFFFNSARNMAAASSLADAASPTVLTFLRWNLFLNLCNHPLLAVKGLVSSSIPTFFWKSLCRHKAFSRNTLPSMGTLYSHLPPTNVRLFPPSLTLYHALQQ